MKINDDIFELSYDNILLEEDNEDTNSNNSQDKYNTSNNDKENNEDIQDKDDKENNEDNNKDNDEDKDNKDNNKDTQDKDDKENNEDNQDKDDKEDDNFNIDIDNNKEEDTDNIDIDNNKEEDTDNIDKDNNDNTNNEDISDDSKSTKDLYDQMYKDLTPEEKANRDMVLKNQYKDLRRICNILIQNTGYFPNTLNSQDIIQRLIESLTSFKNFINYYLSYIYSTKSYIENNIEYNKYLQVLNGIKIIYDDLAKIYNSK